MQRCFSIMLNCCKNTQSFFSELNREFKKINGWTIKPLFQSVAYSLIAEWSNCLSKTRQKKIKQIYIFGIFSFPHPILTCLFVSETGYGIIIDYKPYSIKSEYVNNHFSPNILIYKLRNWLSRKLIASNTVTPAVIKSAQEF